LTTLVGAVFMLIWRINIDGWLGAGISLVIIKAGFGMLSGTLDDILGKRITIELSENVKTEILTFEGVLGVFDLFLESYGPEKLVGSCHVEINDNMSAARISKLTRDISAHIYAKYGILLTCGIYAAEIEDKVINSLREEISARVRKYPAVLQLHGFSLDESLWAISFDVVLDFSVKN
jgi:divalent metal cation (Fe/Co/Zn/Cd) transporter